MGGLPIDNFPTPFTSDHGQQRLTKVTVCCRVPNDVITEYHQTQVVYIVNVILLHVDTILNKQPHSNKYRLSHDRNAHPKFWHQTGY